MTQSAPQSAQGACRRFKLPVDNGYTCDSVVCGVSRKSAHTKLRRVRSSR